VFGEMACGDAGKARKRLYGFDCGAVMPAAAAKAGFL